MFTDRTGNNSLSSTFINTQENLNGTKNRTQQDIQTPSHFVNEEIVETMPTTTQQSNKAYPRFILNLQLKKKYSISANNYTIHSKTVRYSKILTNGLSNI